MKRKSAKKIIVIDDIDIKPDASISVQVKLRIEKDHKNILDRVDLFFCINSALEDKKIYDWKYLENNISHSSNTKKWLETDLDWVTIKG